MIYQFILAEISESNLAGNALIAEIGIGSTNPSVPSNVGVSGTPGASLRAFRNFAPEFRLVGGDVDESVLVHESGISSFHVDQLSIESLNTFADRIVGFDLVIDDGLHEIDANLNTFMVFAARAKPGACIVIEDIDLQDTIRRLWLTVAHLSQDSFECWLLQAPFSLVFVARRRLAFA